MSDRVGDIHDGIITGVAKFGFFVELVDVFVEGLVHVSTLAGDYYQYDQPSQTLVGERTAVTYSMGDKVGVQVARVNVAERKMDFELVDHAPLASRRKPQKASGKKKVAKKGAASSASDKPAGKKPRTTKAAAAKAKTPSKAKAKIKAPAEVTAGAAPDAAAKPASRRRRRR